MRFKRVGRFGTTSALVATAFGMSIVVTPSSASADSTWECYGKEVRRCATVWWDESADTYRARAKVTDVAGGGNYQVKVTDVKLRRFDGEKEVTVRTAKDYDGWKATEDLAGTSAVDPCRWAQSFSVAATYSWRKDGKSGEDTWSPNMGWSLLCR